MIFLKIAWEYIKKNLLKSIGVLVTVILVGILVRHYLKYQRMKEDIIFMSAEITKQDSIIVLRDSRIITDSTIHADQVKEFQLLIVEMRAKSKDKDKKISELDKLVLDMAKGLKCVRYTLFGSKYKIVDCPCPK
jgi:esterase/lipase